MVFFHNCYQKLKILRVALLGWSKVIVFNFSFMFSYFLLLAYVLSLKPGWENIILKED